MKKRILILLSLFIALPFGGCVKVDDTVQPIEVVQTNAEKITFKISDLAKYQGVAVKTFVESDSMYMNNKKRAVEIQGTKELERVLGNEKVYYKTKYVYIGNETLQMDGKATWFHFSPPSFKGKKKYGLYYQTNEIMQLGRAGDTLVVGKKSADEMTLIIAQNGSSQQRELLKLLSSGKTKLAEDKPSKKIEQIQEPEDPKEYKVINNISEKTWMRIYFTPGPDCENNIIDEFKTAKKTVDIAVYAINNPRIFDALADAHQRGVKIRIVTDRLESSKKNAKIITGKIESLGIPVRNNKGTKHLIEHNKWAIFDGKEIEFGSYNWTESATSKNSESCLFFEQPKTEDLTERFKYLWKFYEK